MTRTYVDIHALQTVPPSNLNRDDTGSPKTAYYGGVQRARVSSQAWKRATRAEFKDLLDPGELGVRTKRVVELIANAIRDLDQTAGDDAEALAEGVLSAAGLKLKKDAKSGSAESAFLLFLSRAQVHNLAGLALKHRADGTKIDSKAAKLAADTEHSVDLALFGRMVADATDLTVDATAQVAHAISVHAVSTEFDYFTAVDDEKAADPAEDAGAGMIGTVEFNSSTLYRYATVNVEALDASLGEREATIRAVQAFVRAFVTSMPTGKQNTFANRTLPDAVLVAVRDDQPVNLVGAFERPIRSTDASGRVEEAARRLATFAGDVERAYGNHRVATFVVRVGDATESLDVLGAGVTLDELVEGVGAAVTDHLPRS